MRLPGIRWGVRGVLALGVAASTVANILHAEPNGISRTIAAWPPLALLLTIELIARIPVRGMWLAIARLCAAAGIAGIAAWVSYWHMAGVAQRYGETDAAPYLIPVSVDGLVVVASVCLVELAGRIRTAEVAPVVLPPVEPVSAQVTSDPEPPVLPPVDEAPPAEVIADATATRKPRRTGGTSTAKRPFAVTQRAAAALQADGMDVPAIASALGITPRQARAALKPVSVGHPAAE